MWQTIIGFIGGPVIKGLLDAYSAHLKATTDDNTIAADLAGKEVAAQTVETQTQTQYRIAELGHWYEPDKIMGYTVAVYFAKLLIWDKVLGLGTTDPLKDFAATTASAIVFYYFAKRGAENLAQIFKSILRR
jgi:hypothetical protein